MKRSGPRRHSIVFFLLHVLGVSFSVACQGESAMDDGQRSQTIEVDHLVTAVGNSEGRLAIQFNGEWFAVFQEAGNWKVENHVQATDLYVTSSDSSTKHSLCAEGSRVDRQYIIENCNGVLGTEILEKRIFPAEAQSHFHVGDHLYRVEVTQNLRDDVYVVPVDGPRRRLSATRDLSFRISFPDSLDGNHWNIQLTAKRSAGGNVDISDEELNQQVTESVFGEINEASEKAQAQQLKEDSVRYTSEVELEYVNKETSAAETDLASKTNPALDAAFAAGSAVPIDHSQPEAIAGFSKMSGLLRGGKDNVYQFVRLYQFFMKADKGKMGFSRGSGVCGPGKFTSQREGFGKDADGSGDKGQVLNSAGALRFNAPVSQCRHYWPFFMGLCGAEVRVDIGVAGSLTYGTKSCHNAVPVQANFQGCVEFKAEAGAGFSCDVFVASASVGLKAGISTGACFSTSFDAFDGSLHASNEFYARMHFNAYLQYRFLFWNQMYARNLGTLTRYGGRVSRRLLEIPSLRDANKLCEKKKLRPVITNAVEDNECEGAGTACDADNRCIRQYEYCLTPYQGPVDPETKCEVSEWAREDVGPCKTTASSE